MAKYRISGIWKDSNDTITHYAIHEVLEESITRAKKISKVEAVQLLENWQNTAYTWMWNYGKAEWKVGEKVEVIKGSTGKYLRSNPDNSLTDNLEHLIDYDWISLK